MPTAAEASFFSSILGNAANAEVPVIDPTQPVQTSGTMALLKANVSSASVLEDAKTPGVNSSVDVKIVSDTAILPTTGPLGVSDSSNSSNLDTSIYVVRKGDTIATIAKMFNVSVNTILSVNDMKKGDSLTEGAVLFILPISGIRHTVASGQTLQGIAKLYGADVNDIIEYNDIPNEAKLAVGEVLIVPGGDMANEGGDKPAANLNSTIAKDKTYYASNPLQKIAGYFINPVPVGVKTQGLHGPGMSGIDIGAPTWSPIYASAPGVVITTKTGCVVGYRNCGGGYGNMVIIQHPNGTNTVTVYGHMVKVNTYTGATVTRGQIIGYVGSTGHSTGPHLHFEVHGAKNPGADWSWASWSY
ncbi:MAG: M23 family metallopeptidase [bacterium]